MVRDFEDRTIQRYNRLNPGSRAASDYVKEMFLECANHISKLMATPERPAMSIRISPSVHEALEATLNTISDPKRIIVLPFAEPHIVPAASHYAKMPSTEFCALSTHPGDWTRRWEEQEQSMIGELKSLAAKDDKPCVVIISEVMYSLGLRLPLSTLIPQVRDALGQSRTTVIVEGSQGAGNGSNAAALNTADAYVFTSDRWMLSTAPFGITLSFGGSIRPRAEWTGDEGQVPTTYCDARRFANLLGSLDVLNEIGFDYFWKRCHKLREQFLLLLPSKLQIVGAAMGLEKKFFMTICPASGKAWRIEAKELTDVLQERLIYAPVSQVDAEMVWLRIALPYFLDVRELNRLCYTLDDLVR